MSYFRTEKVISSLPEELVADTIYFVRDGAGYRLVVSDTTGSITYEQNLPENSVRSFSKSVDLVVGETTFVHGLGLKDKRGFNHSVIDADDEAVFVGVKAVDTNTIIITSLVAQTDVYVTVMGS
jgi:hypothetical protein